MESLSSDACRLVGTSVLKGGRLQGLGVGWGWGRSQSEAGLTELAAPRGCPIPSTSLPPALWLVTLQ